MEVTKFDLLFEFYMATFWFSDLMRFLPENFENSDEIQTFTELHQQIEQLAQRILSLERHYQFGAKTVKGSRKATKELKRNPNVTHRQP